MHLTDNLIFGAVIVAFLGTGSIHAWWVDRVIAILKERHPETWRDFQGPIFVNRSAFASFLNSDQHQGMNDPELSRAVRKSKLTFAIVVVCFLAVAVTMITQSKLAALETAHLTTTPPFITDPTCSSTEMSAIASPSTAIMSA